MRCLGSILSKFSVVSYFICLDNGILHSHRLSLMVNIIKRLFFSFRGIRQGHHLSLNLFIMAQLMLSRGLSLSISNNADYRFLFLGIVLLFLTLFFANVTLFPAMDLGTPLKMFSILFLTMKDVLVKKNSFYLKVTCCATLLL